MSNERPVEFLPRRANGWRIRLQRRAPLAIWLAVLALVIWLYGHGGEYARVNALVEVVTEQVAPMKTGRLVSVDVVQGQVVEAGQVVARMDTRLLEEQLAVLAQRIQQERAQDERQLLLARQRIAAELREHELALAEAALQVELYGAELERLVPLVAKGLARSDDLLALRARHEVARVRQEQLPRLVAALQRELAELESLGERILSDHAAEENGLARTRLDLLSREIESMTLRAQQAGVVGRVRREPGEVVDAGQTVLDLILQRPPRILAFMDEADTRPVAVGDEVLVERPIEKGRFRARVESISPHILALPDRASPIPNRVVRGRRLDLVPLEPVELVPGASLVVILRRDRGFWTHILGGRSE